MSALLDWGDRLELFVFLMGFWTCYLQLQIVRIKAIFLSIQMLLKSDPEKREIHIFRGKGENWPIISIELIGLWRVISKIECMCIKEISLEHYHSPLRGSSTDVWQHLSTITWLCRWEWTTKDLRRNQSLKEAEFWASPAHPRGERCQRCWGGGGFWRD